MLAASPRSPLPSPLRALSVRQPYAELILRGIKRIEYRSRPTKIIGERFYLYACKKKWSVASGQLPVWSKDLTGEQPPDWMIELAEQVALIEAEEQAGQGGLPTGVIVGSAIIEKVTPLPFPPPTNNRQPTTLYQWHLAAVQRLPRPGPPRRHPQPVWFRPF